MKRKFTKGIMLFSLFAGVQAFAQTPEQSAQIIKQYDLEKAKEMIAFYADKAKKDKEEALRLAKINGWPETYVDHNNGYNVLVGVTETGAPLYHVTHNVGSAITARVNRVNTGGSAGLNLNGQGMIMGIWDGGPVRAAHQDLTGRVTYKNGAFFTHSEGTGHATHVAGTMIGSGVGNSAAKGLAYEASLWSYDSSSDASEAIAFAALEGKLVSNHSYGYNIAAVPPYYKGAYIQESATWDNIMFNFPYYQPVFSAGNDRGTAQDTQAGRDLLTDKATTKNGVVVAAVNQVFNYTGPTSVTMSSFSSWGPTDDFRIKPDISAKGVAVFSTYSQSTTSYTSLQGTSMSAPAVSACLTLMQQHYNALNGQFMKSATLRALMVNSADEAGTAAGPDHRFGWGLINTEKAVQMISGRNTTTYMDELTLGQGQVYTRTVTASGTVPLNVTLAWTDPAGPINNGTLNDPTPVLVNDLDVRVTKVGGDQYLPWMLNPNFLNAGAIQGDNIVDNIESIDIAGASGQYVITVTHKGNLQGNAQDFSLVIDGIIADANSVAENNLDKFVVYPNPAASGTVHVKFDEETTGDSKITMYDVNGRSVLTYNYKNEGQLDVALDVSMISPGVYFLNVEQSGKVSTKKLVIQ